MSSKLFGGILPLLERSLDAATLRQQVIADNIANIDTPGYKRSTVAFDEQLQQALGRGGFDRRSAKHPSSHNSAVDGVDVSQITPTVVKDRSSTHRLDGNNVDIEIEMTRLAKNSLTYAMLVRQLGSRYDWLRAAITGGRR